VAVLEQELMMLMMLVTMLVMLVMMLVMMPMTNCRFLTKELLLLEVFEFFYEKICS
jgi:hypothetical protein